ncbi:hypothetical protein QCA50_004829 [Cerrena zonata]|uniref:Uncharacterized protein n=1 Tax=Cerrena zonata TaxID=2478898 RepID=A0AAW0GJU8_9APHY
MSSTTQTDTPSFFDISGFVFELLGIAGTFQIICVIIFYYFPRRRLHGLETTYAEAYSLYHCGLEEGVLDSDKRRIEESLLRTRRKITQVRSEVFCLGGFWRQVFAIFGRLSQKFSYLDAAVKELCADIASSSQKGRRDLEARGQSYTPCMLPLMRSVPITLGPTGTYTRPTRGADQPHNPYTQSDSPHCALTPHQLQGHHSTEPDSTPPFASHSASIDFRRSPVHRDSLCSVSTSSTAVNTDSVQLGELGYQQAPSPDISQTTPLAEDLKKTIDPTIRIDARYKDIHHLMELLLFKLHHLPELCQKTEERDISDEFSAFESRLSKLQHTWTPSSRPPILPL